MLWTVKSLVGLVRTLEFPPVLGRRHALAFPRGSQIAESRDGGALSQGHHNLGNDLREALAAQQRFLTEWAALWTKQFSSGPADDALNACGHVVTYRSRVEASTFHRKLTTKNVPAFRRRARGLQAHASLSSWPSGFDPSTPPALWACALRFPSVLFLPRAGCWGGLAVPSPYHGVLAVKGCARLCALACLAAVAADP